MSAITLYTAATPNGWNVSIALEELGVQYDVKALSLQKSDQKQPEFLKINPNGRIPAIVDHNNNDFAVFESGAILLYLADRYDKEHRFWPEDKNKQSLVVQWIMFQMSGLGPMQGQANHFLRKAPEKITYGIERYISETKRLYKVLDEQLKDKQYIIGDQYTIADMCIVPWILLHCWSGVAQNLDEYANLKAWAHRVHERPAVKRGVAVPDKDALSKMKSKAENPEEAERRPWIMEK